MSAPTGKRPELTFDELCHLKWLLGGLLTLLSLGAMLYMDIEAWALMGVTALVTLSTMLWPQLPGRVPAVVHLLAFPVIVSFFAADVWLSQRPWGRRLLRDFQPLTRHFSDTDWADVAYSASAHLFVQQLSNYKVFLFDK